MGANMEMLILESHVLPTEPLAATPAKLALLSTSTIRESKELLTLRQMVDGAEAMIAGMKAVLQSATMSAVIPQYISDVDLAKRLALPLSVVRMDCKRGLYSGAEPRKRIGWIIPESSVLE